MLFNDILSLLLIDDPKNNKTKLMVFRSFIIFVFFKGINFLDTNPTHTTIPGFLGKDEKVVTSSRRFSQERRWRREKRNVFEAKFGSGEIMSSWETDDRRGDYLLYLHLPASTFLARALSFLFAFDLTTSLGMKKNYSNCLHPFESSICHKDSFYV